MRSRLRLFLIVGLLATTLDIAVVVALWDRGLVVADVAALASAAVLAYLLNRYITFRGRPAARWVRRPSLFAATAIAAGLVDLSVLYLLDRAGLVLVPAKIVAIGAAAVLRWMAYRRILFNQVRRELGERVARPPVAGDRRLSVVIPAYNEEGLIGETVSVVARELTRSLDDGSYEVIVVDDGSSDRTGPMAAQAGARLITLEENRGKGAAVRAGVLGADGRAVVFTDADLAYPAGLIVEVLDHVEAGWDVVVGSRRHTDTNTLVRAGRLRELGGRVINLLTHAVLLGHFHDTQCGLKGFRRDIGVVIFERIRTAGFAFDVEIFLMAEQDRLSLIEIPVSVTNRVGSSVRIVGDTVDLLVDLFRIRRWAGSGHYRPTEAQAAVINARAESY